MAEKKINVLHIGGFLLIPFCSLITHTILPIPPTVILFLLSFLIAIFYLIKNPKISKINLISVPSLLFSIYLFISQLVIGVDIRALFGPFLAPLYFVLTLFYLDLLKNEKSKKFITSFIYISVFIFVIEAVWRILHPSFNVEAIKSGNEAYQWFYVFKGTGLMYLESNAVAIHVIVVLFFTFWWEDYLQKKFTTLKILLILVLCLAFSRAAIFSFGIGIIYYKYLRKMKNNSFYTLILFSSVIFIFTLPTYIIPFLQKDASANTKVELISEVLKYYSNADWISIIFGIGNYNSQKAFSIYAHNYILVFAVETGIVGLTLLFTQFLNFVKKSRNESLVILIPFLVQVMSSTTIFIPHFYMVSAIIVYFSRQSTISTLNSYNKAQN